MVSWLCGGFKVINCFAKNVLRNMCTTNMQAFANSFMSALPSDSVTTIVWKANY